MKTINEILKNHLLLYLCVLFFQFAPNLFGQESSSQKSGDETVDETYLPTGRAIDPAGKTIDFNGRPVDIDVSHDGKWLLVKDRSHFRIIDPESFELVDSIDATGGASIYGLTSDVKGNIYFSNTSNLIHIFRVSEKRKCELKGSIELPNDSFPCGLYLSSNGKHLFACLSKKNTLAIIDLATETVIKEIEVGIAPFDVVQVGEHLVVSNIGGRRPRDNDKTSPSAGTETVVDDRGIASTGTLSIVSLKDQSTVGEVAVGLHPSALVAQNTSVLVCNTNQDSLSFIDLKNGFDNITVQNITAKPDEKLPFGSMPSCLCWLPDQKHLLVTLAGNNAVAVFEKTDSGKFEMRGQVPTAWFPAGLASSRDFVFVANVKGFGARAEIRETEKGHNSHDHQGVIQRIAITDILDQNKLDSWSKQVAENSKLAQIVRNQVINSDLADVEPSPVPAKLGMPSHFKHIIYVIKENRTFDQVFGDYETARSDPNLCLFPRRITPNHHALADRFGILDNYYCNGVLSADGHSWATEGNVTPYLERAFGGFSRSYTFGDDPITYSSSGFLWDHVLAAGLSFRNYGEFDYAEPPDGIKYQEIFRRFEAGDQIEFKQNIGVDRVRNYSCRDYPGWNMEIPDVLRIDRFLTEFREFEKQGTLPNLCIIYLPQDHLGAAGVTSNAHMADNDLALGRLVEAVSHSPFWKDTVIFVNEDDPQNGFDHIDGHRSICLAISAYSKKGVNHSFYNQTSVLRTMLHIFGLPPMNQQDASAPLMNACFQATADLTPYEAIDPETRLDESPKKQSEWSPEEAQWRKILATVPIERTGMKTPTDEDNLNRFIWHDVKGWKTTYPTEFAGPHGRGLKSLGLKFEDKFDGKEE